MLDIGVRQVEQFLTGELARPATAVEVVGAGAWSQCFGFCSEGLAYVIRFGDHLDDFAKDRFAQRFASPHLPIPELSGLGPAFDGHYAITTRAPGLPLEAATADEWPRTIVSLVTALEAMRRPGPGLGSGWGGWDGGGDAPHPTWRDHLLAVDIDDESRRTHGWGTKLRRSSAGEAAFRWGYALLEEVAPGRVPRGLVHCDLINRNVHVADGQITGVFDWGCAIYGDHLYDRAWLEFWAPWNPRLDIAALGDALDAVWRAEGYQVDDRADRTTACHLHIGLDHLAYNAHLGDWHAVAAVADRMRLLVSAA